MKSRITQRSILSCAVLATLGLPFATARASTPQGPETPAVSMGGGQQREASAAIGRSDPSTYPYEQHNRAIVVADNSLLGSTLVDSYRDVYGTTHEITLGGDSNCPPRTPSVALTWPSYFSSFEQVVAWACTQLADGASVVRLQSVDGYGTLFPGPLGVGGSASTEQDNPVVSVNGPNRDGYIAWTGKNGLGNYGVFFDRLYGGTPAGAANAIEYSPRSPTPLQPSLVADTQNGALIAWTGPLTQPPYDHGVQLAVIDARFGIPQTLVLDHDYFAAFGTAMVSQERQGQKVVVWTRDGGVFAQRIDSSNQPAGGVLTVAPIDGTIRSAARVTVDERDGFWIGWQSTGQDGDGEGIYVRQYRRDGTPVDPETLVNEITAGDQLFGSIGSPYVGRLNAVWTRPESGNHITVERTMLGLSDDDYFPSFRINGTEAGQLVQVDVDFNHQSPGGSITPLQNFNAVIQLPADSTDVSVFGLGTSCSGIGTTTVTCPMFGLGSNLSITFLSTPASGDIPITVTMDLPFVDGIPSDNTASTVLHVQDTRPDPIQFSNVENVTPGALVVSAPVTLSGFDVPQAATVDGGEYSLDGVNFSTGGFTASAGQQVWLRHTAAAVADQSVYTTLTVNQVSGTFTSTTGVADGTPDAFSLGNTTAALPNSEQISNTITVHGINVRAPISVSGGEYSVDGGWFTSEPGVVVAGAQVRVRQFASSSYSTTTDATLTIGGVSATYSVTTQDLDTTPNPFAFTDVTGVQPNTTQTSSTIVVSGINAWVPISVSGGSYSINNAAFTTAGGSVKNGDWVRVQHTASASYGTAVNTTLTIGGVSDTFTSTTRVLDTTPNAFAFFDVVDVPIDTVQTSNAVVISGIDSPAPISVVGGSYSINGGPFTTVSGSILNGQSVRVQHQSAPTFLTAVNTTLTIGGVSDTYTSRTVRQLATPYSFTFTDIGGVARGSVQTSNAIVVGGINTPVPVSVVGGSYSVDGGPFTSASGQVSNGASIRVQHTASAQFSTATNTTLTIGGVSDTFTSTTLAADTTPDAFGFTDVAGVGLGATTVSNAITVAGINTAAPISVVGGSYSIDGGAFTSAAGTVQAGQSVRVQHTASAQFSTATNTTLTIGGVSDTFTSTTLAADTTPNAFSFTDVTGVNRNAVVTSNTITINGINTAAPISISGGNATYSRNGGAYTTAAGTVNSGDTVTLKVTSSGTRGGVVNVVLTVGGVSDTWSVTTK